MSSFVAAALAARYAKARRGELVVAAPVGFVKVGDHYRRTGPRSGRAILVFDKVEERRSASGAACHHEHDLDLP
jgi:hypothetical protein